MNLRNSRFTNIENEANFFHSQFFEIIKTKNLSFLFVEFIDGLSEKSAQLRTHGDVEWIILRTSSDGGLGVVGAGIFHLLLNAAKIEPAKFAEYALKLGQRDRQFFRNFRFGG